VTARASYGSRLTPPGYVTIQQAAQEGEMSTRTVRSAIAAGDLRGATKIRTGRAGELWILPCEEVGRLAMLRAAGLTRTARRDAALARGRARSIAIRRERAARRMEVTDLAQLGGQLLVVAGAQAVSTALDRAGLPPSLPLSQIPPTWRAAARSALVSQLHHR